ncbi:MAG TPA: ribonucleoside-diphosphate reductase, partial [Clostridiaceae bacterium]
DASKASQPLNISLHSEVDMKLEDLTYDELLAKAKELQKIEKGGKYSTRNKPVGIRRGTTHPAQIDDVKIYTTVNRRGTGEISEIYITTDREGTIITGLLNSLSKSISVMLQYHVPPQDIARMLRGQKYEPYGFVQKHPYIKYVSSISDLVSKVIDIELGDYSRCQAKPENYDPAIINQMEVSSKAALDVISPNPTSKDGKITKVEGERVYGSTCPNCSSTRMIRNGTCMVCLDCGSTTGCS